MNRILIHLPLVASLAVMPSCGTILSRSDNPVGGVPGAAVALDVMLIGVGVSGGKSIMGGAIRSELALFAGLASLPLDLCLDAVLLPVDLGAWAFGVTKFADD